MKKYLIIGALILVFAGVAGFYFFHHHEKQALAAEAAAAQNTFTVTTGSIQAKVHGIGVVQSLNDQILKANSQETIDKVEVHAGSTVKEGQTLITFDKLDLSSDMTQAEYQVSLDQISLAADERNLANSKTQPNYNLQDKVSKDKIILQEANDKLQNLENKEQVPSIIAPFSGTVVSVSSGIRSGQNVDKGTTLIEIADMSHLQLVLPIDELDILKVHPGQTVNVQLNALPKQEVQGKVSSIADVGKVQNGVSTFNVTVDLQPISQIKPGMTGQGDILTANKSGVLIIPITAIQVKNGKQYVMLETSGGKNKLTKIKTGIHNDSYVEVTSGLKKGDKIVIPKKYTISTKKSKRKKKNKNSPLSRMFGGKSGGKKRNK